MACYSVHLTCPHGKLPSPNRYTVSSKSRYLVKYYRPLFFDALIEMEIRSGDSDPDLGNWRARRSCPRFIRRLRDDIVAVGRRKNSPRRDTVGRAGRRCVED